MARRVYEMTIEQRAKEYHGVVISSEILLEVNDTEDVEVITNLMMKYGKGKIDITTKCKNYVEESEE